MMKISRRTFIESTITSALGVGLVTPVSLPAKDNTSLDAAAGRALPLKETPKVWQQARGTLTTRWSKEVTPDNVWPEYPRPHLVRDRWLNLNGLWDYQITEKDETSIPTDHAGQILVPFALESPLSGVMEPLLPNQRLWYQRDFDIPAAWASDRILLHFGAVDWESTIYLNGRKLGTHRGGYDNFSFDITKHLKNGGRHQIVVSVWDGTDTEWQLRGKQTLHPGGCSYTASSGIWQTAWLEPVPESHIEKLELIPDLDRRVLKLQIAARTMPQPLSVQAIAIDAGKEVANISGAIGSEITPEIQKNLVGFYKAKSIWVSTTVEIPIPNPKTWSPDSPFLYDLKVQLKDEAGTILDSVTSYFGMRSVKVGHDTEGNTRLMLNGQPILLPGALDQGFWPDGVYLAPTDEALRFDIEWARKLGLNTVRKHVKIEAQRWYYWADKLGLMVFQDMPTGNCGDPATDIPASPEAADQWRSEITHIIQDKFNHPCIVCWDIFNESFGGFDYLRNAAWIQQMDPSRLTNESSGFPWHGGGNVRDGHGGISFKDRNCITIISENGTPSLGCSGHEWPHAWSYGSYDPQTGKSMNFLAYYNKNKGSAILPDITSEAKVWLTKAVSDFFGNFLRDTVRTGISGNFYCQLVDVETECDGLISYDRAAPKVDADQVAQAIRDGTPKILPA